MRLYIITTSLFFLISSILTCDQNNCVIHIQSESSKSIRLQSILSLGLLIRNQTVRLEKLQKIFWSFKRVFFGLEAEQEVSQLELMISLDSEVQDNLKQKYSIYLNEDNKYDLIIANLTYSDSGLYKCNLWNQMTIYYHLTIRDPIVKPVLLPSYNELIKEGDNLDLKCLSKNAYPYPKFKWLNNGILIKDNIQVQLVDRETNLIESSLNIKSINSSLNSNNITCLAIQNLNSTQIEMTESIILNVGYKPKLSLSIQNLKKNLNLTNNSKLNIYESDVENIKFTCDSKSNPTESSIKWFINENLLQSESKPILKLNNINFKKFILACQVENSIGISEFRVEVNILYEPKIKLDKTSYEIDEFTPFQLNCLYDSSPNVTRIQWRKLLSENSEIVSETGLLDFKQVKMKENSGFYECRVTNFMLDSFGLEKKAEINYKIELIIRFVPIMSVNFKKQASNVTRKSVNLSCVTMSYPEPKFTWFKNGLQLLENDKFKVLTIKKSKNLFESNLNLNDLGEEDFNQKYECQAMNQLGSNKVEIELVPLSKPDMPSELRSLYVSFSTVGITWTPGFDGGLEQKFTIQLNDTVLELNSSNLANITNLSVNTIYSVRVMAKNLLGQSNWSDFILIRTKDLTENDRNLLPVFDSLFLNVPKNRLEFEFKTNSVFPICFRLIGKIDMNNFKSLNCLKYDLKNLNQLLLDKIELDDGIFDSKLINSLKVDICFQSKSTVCSERPMTAIIDTYNKISHSSLIKKPDNFLDNLKLFSPNTIPVALVIGISICILTLIILLFVTIIFCIRKKNFKLCKSILSQQNLGTKPFDEKIKKFLSDQNRLSHSKSFNIDIQSISAPVASTVSISGSQLTSSTSSETSNLKHNGSTRRTFTAALTQTANNILHNSIGRSKINEILVTDEEKLDSATSSTAVSNCSSQNLNTPYLFTDYTLFDQQGLKCESSTGSNSDPIAINNSLTSNSTSNSPIYGYNIAGATNAHTLSVQNTNLESVFHVQQMNFQPNFQTDDSSLVRQQTCNILSKQFKMNSKIIMDQQSTESGYSTPSRPKKVVYEVIV
ncbi:unnamed protein product [Brachionus calyciflorus]|uniref:Uncharacterized protein n=1 Tax=Brachionus calyciflorus TaxID=104777 RepID=A0A813NLA7_9BILA|nr:unnamed protein product [Brachionus calyciflorus]